MANSRQASKRARQAEVRRQLNADQRSNARTFMKKVGSAIESGDKAQAEQAFRVAQPLMDRAGRKDQIHPNNIARQKKRMSALIKAMS